MLQLNQDSKLANMGPPKRVLVTKLGHIGDVLVITPFLKVLKDIFPGVHTTVLVNQGTEEMVQGCKYADRVLLVKRGQRGLWQRMRDSLRLIGDLRREPLDISFELSAGDRGSYLCRVAGASLRIGYTSDNGHVRDRIFHEMLPRYEEGMHEVENFLRQLTIFQHSFDAPPLQWQPNSNARQRAMGILQKHNLEKYILIHPTSRWMFKAWTPEKNAQVINHLNRKGWPVLLSAGPDNAEMDYIERLQEHLEPDGKVANLAGKLNLTLLGALIEKATLFFGVDSAPMHMAAAVQTPTVVLFGPSGEHMWGPWQVKHKVLSGQCPIRPCGRDGCNGSKICNSLVELPVSTVCQAIDEMLPGVD